MKDIILFDGPERSTLLPLTYLRPACDCRVGMLTVAEKWEKHLASTLHRETAVYLQDLFPLPTNVCFSLWINGAVLPSVELIEDIDDLKNGQMLVCGSKLIAARTDDMAMTSTRLYSEMEQWETIEVEVDIISYPEDILVLCDQEFNRDYSLLVDGQESAVPDTSVRCRGEEIFIHPSAKVYDCILNASEGPIYIGPEAEVMEQAVVKGPVGIGSNSTIHVGAKVYAHTMLGPYCKIGGEIKRSTLFGYTNKAHEGYLGDSVLGHWCNLGADTNNSNMKNTYGQVSLWSPMARESRVTARQFLGDIMGDHTMSAINTANMSGSVTGVFANVFGKVYPARWSPSFSWGDAELTYDTDRAIEVAKRAMSRRGIELSLAYMNALKHIAAIEK